MNTDIVVQGIYYGLKHLLKKLRAIGDTAANKFNDSIYKPFVIMHHALIDPLNTTNIVSTLGLKITMNNAKTGENLLDWVLQQASVPPPSEVLLFEEEEEEEEDCCCSSKKAVTTKKKKKKKGQKRRNAPEIKSKVPVHINRKLVLEGKCIYHIQNDEEWTSEKIDSIEYEEVYESIKSNNIENISREESYKCDEDVLHRNENPDFIKCCDELNNEHTEECSDNELSDGHEHTVETSDQHTNERSNEHGNERSNEHGDERSNEHGDERSNEHSNEHGDEHSNEHGDERSNEHGDERSNGDNKRSGEHGDERNDKHSDEHGDEHGEYVDEYGDEISNELSYDEISNEEKSYCERSNDLLAYEHENERSVLENVSIINDLMKFPYSDPAKFKRCIEDRFQTLRILFRDLDFYEHRDITSYKIIYAKIRTMLLSFIIGVHITDHLSNAIDAFIYTLIYEFRGYRFLLNTKLKHTDIEKRKLLEQSIINYIYFKILTFTI